MTDLIFSFDTEDFTSEKAADAILKEAEILRSENIRGCFCLVGLLARQLREWNRTDVLDALSCHEIDFHTYGHTYHPMIDEYTDLDSFGKAYELCLEEEGLGIGYVKDVTGRDRIFAAVPPGNQKNYVAMYTYADMGIPIYADTVCDPYNGKGMFYCNIYHIEYVHSLEGFLLHWDDKRVSEIIEELAARPRAVIYTHPNVAVAKSWWDIDNYDKENLTEFGNWIPAEKRPEEETEEFLGNIRRFIRLLKADGRFRFSTYEEQAERLARRPTRVIYRDDLTPIERVVKNMFPEEGINSISIADAFGACVDFLNGKSSHVCGKTKGFLKQPYSVTDTVHIDRTAMTDSAKLIDITGFLPEKITVGDIILGPADWLRAAVCVLSGQTDIAVTPGAQLPCLDFLPDLRDQSLKGTWRHSDSFNDDYLSERLRLQSWTMRF